MLTYELPAKDWELLALPYVVKTSDIIEACGSELMLRERPMYGGDKIEPGDSLFLWSSGKEGRLLGRGDVSRVSRDDEPYLTLYIEHLDWNVSGPLTTRALQPFRDCSDDNPMTGLSRLLYRHAHNKVALLPQQAAELLSRQFASQQSPVPSATKSRTPIGQTIGGRLAIGALLIAAALVSVALFLGSRTGDVRQPAEAQPLQNPSVALDAAPESTPSDSEVKTFSISTLPGAPGTLNRFRKMHLNDPQKVTLRSEVTNVGYGCGSVNAAYEMENTTEKAGLIRVECTESNYQITLVNGNSYVKPWTGVAFGANN